MRTGEGLDELRSALRQALEVGEEPLRDTPLVTNLRHEQLLREARGALARAREGLAARGHALDEELVLADIAAARAALESITGRRTTEDVLRRIFERFCIGK
jgi:tRNA modification GTPase